MATTAAEIFVLKFGTNLTAAPSDPVTLIRSIDGPSMENEAVETSVLGSGARTFRASKKPDMGSVSLTCVYDKALTDHDALVTSLKSGTVYNWAIDDGTSALFTFNGFVTSISPSGADVGSPDDLVFEVEIKVTGDVTFA